MKENQNIEFKEIWKDEYLKHISGFANSKGGKLYIGINDNGKVVGIDNSKKLIKEIPNKIKETLGIIVDATLLNENNLYYIEISINSYSFPISYKGKYYLRSGSNTHEVTGEELNNFVLKKVGTKWDNVIIPEATFDDISMEAINYFKEKAINNKRLSEEELNVSTDILLKKLGLYDGNNITRAGILLFGKNPEKYITNAYVKIGSFSSITNDLLFQDEIHGPLIMQVDKVIDSLYGKFLKALIHYEGI